MEILSNMDKPSRDLYFDNNATTAVHPDFIPDIIKHMNSSYGNASCSHKMGIDASYELERSRAKVATNLGTKPENIIFTSGASESVSLVLNRFRNLQIPIITTNVEHDCVDKCARRIAGERLHIKIPIVNCRVHPKDIKKALVKCSSCNSVCVSLLYVSNETGNILIKNVPKLVKMIKKRNHDNFVHLDITQAVGKMYMNLDEMGIDAASFSGHKIHAPKGVGALYIRNPQHLKNHPLIYGGGQEFGIRGGTENIAAISAFGKAMDFVHTDMEGFVKYSEDILDYIVNELVELKSKTTFNYKIFTNPSNAAVCTTLFFGYSHDGEVDVKKFIDYLSDNHVYVSTGSACNNNTPELSKTVTSLGLEETIGANCIRISLSRFSTMDEVVEMMDIFKTYFINKLY